LQNVNALPHTAIKTQAMHACLATELQFNISSRNIYFVKNRIFVAIEELPSV